MAPMDRSMPRTRMGKACPIARMATKEKPDIRFSILVAVAKRGAHTLKKTPGCRKEQIAQELQDGFSRQPSFSG